MFNFQCGSYGLVFMIVKSLLAFRNITNVSALKGIEISLSALRGIKYKRLLTRLLP